MFGEHVSFARDVNNDTLGGKACVAGVPRRQRAASHRRAALGLDGGSLSRISAEQADSKPAHVPVRADALAGNDPLVRAGIACSWIGGRHRVSSRFVPKDELLRRMVFGARSLTVGLQTSAGRAFSGFLT